MESNKCKYNSYHNIPARIFFEIRESRDFQLMRPKPNTSTEWLAKLFLQIYDDYFMKSKNKDAQRYSELLEIEAGLETKIKAFASVLEFHWRTPQNIWNHPTVINIRTEQITELNKYLDYPFDLEADFDEQMQTALNVSLGIIKNDLSECQMELEDMRKKAGVSKFEFYERHANINKVNAPYILPPTLLLAEFVEAEKMAIKSQQKNAA